MGQPVGPPCQLLGDHLFLSLVAKVAACYTCHSDLPKRPGSIEQKFGDGRAAAPGEPALACHLQRLFSYLCICRRCVVLCGAPAGCDLALFPCGQLPSPGCRAGERKKLKTSAVFYGLPL